MKQRILALFLALCLCLPLAACGKKQGYDPLEGVKTRVVTDSAGRQVEIPADIQRVAPSGSTAQMILMPIAYDLLAGLSSSPSTAQMPYFPEEVRYLPTFGQFYGSKANLNMESLIDARPQIIIDLGDAKDTIADDMDRIQKQTGIPTVFIEADLDDMAAAYRMLGDILNRAGMAEPLAQFIEKSVAMAQENSAKIPESQRLSVLFGTGSTGLACNAAGSVQADVIDLVGAVNAIIPEEVSNRGGGTTVSLEEVYAVEPDVILLSTGGPYDTLTQGEWAGLTAVQNGRYYEIPGLPYDWMSSPPSVNRVLPNVMTTVIVISTMKVGGLILAEATLSFLGAGVPVTEPSLGMLVKNGFDVLFSGYWWIAVMPGLYIMLIVFGINLLGDFLRDEFNPKLK